MQHMYFRFNHITLKLPLTITCPKIKLSVSDSTGGGALASEAWNPHPIQGAELIDLLVEGHVVYVFFIMVNCSWLGEIIGYVCFNHVGKRGKKNMQVLH